MNDTAKKPAAQPEAGEKRYPLQVGLTTDVTGDEAQRLRRIGNALRVIASANEILRLEANTGDDEFSYAQRVQIQNAVAAYREHVGIDPNDGEASCEDRAAVEKAAEELE